jgi:hypothetical protein
MPPISQMEGVLLFSSGNANTAHAQVDKRTRLGFHRALPRKKCGHKTPFIDYDVDEWVIEAICEYQLSLPRVSWPPAL